MLDVNGTILFKFCEKSMMSVIRFTVHLEANCLLYVKGTCQHIDSQYYICSHVHRVREGLSLGSVKSDN